MRRFRNNAPALAPLVTSRNLSVLILDPNEEHQTLSVTALGRRGFRATVADTGWEGIRLATHQDFDAIVIDAKVKDPGAFEVLRYLVERFPKVPKILVVNPGAEDIALRALDSGAASYLVKTPRYNELLPAEVSAQIERGRDRHVIETQKRALWETVDTLRSLFQASPLAIAVLDREANVKLWSPAAERLFGWSEEEVLGQTIPIIPQDRREEFHRNLERVERGEAILAEEMRRVRKDGTLVDIEATIVPLRDAAGTISGKLAVYTDISGRKKSEADLRLSQERFQLVGQATNDLVWDLDLRTGRVWTNEAIRTLFGYDQDDGGAMLDSFLDRVHPQDRAAFRAGLESFIRSDRTSGYTHEYRLQRKDGTYATVLARGTVLRDETGAPLRVIGTTMDVTRERRTEHLQRALYEISESAASAESLDTLLTRIHSIIADLMPAENLYVALRDPATEFLDFVYFRDEKESRPPPQRMGHGVTEHVLRTGEPLLATPDVIAELVAEGVIEVRGPLAVDWLGVPLRSEGEPFGVLAIQSYTEGVRYGPAEMAILAFVSNQISSAILRKRSEMDLRRTNRALRTLSACNQALVLAEDESTLLQQVCEIIVASGYRMAWVGFPQEDAGRTILPVAVAGADATDAGSWSATWAAGRGGSGPTGTASREGRIAVIQNLEAEGEEAARELPGAWTGCSSVISFPLVLSEPPHGTLTICATERDAFGKEEISLFTTLADNLTYGVTALRERSIRKRTQRELEESERKFRTLFEAAADAILLMDSKGVLRDVNAAGATLFGRPREALLGSRLTDLVPADEADRGRRYCRTVFAGESIPPPFESQVLRADGTRRFVEVHARLVPEGAAGPLVEFVVRDVTERRELARRMEESERLASLGQFASYVAHEVNTPLANISLLSASITRKVDDDDVRDKLRKIDAQRRRAANIITDLLSFSKHREIAPVDTDLGPLVLSAVEQCLPYRRPEVTLRADLSEAPVHVHADPAQIGIVVVNLVKNALQATTRGFVNIRIEERDEGPAIVVEDTGQGMSREVLERLYEPFFTTKKRGEGTGLGLSWSKKLVEAHGGRIDVVSEPGKGTIFTVVLPTERVARAT